MTYIYTYRERCKTGPAHNRCWNWFLFTSKHTWMLFSKFCNTFPKVSTLTAWISWLIASLSCSIVRGVFLFTFPFNMQRLFMHSLRVFCCPYTRVLRVYVFAQMKPCFVCKKVMSKILEFWVRKSLIHKQNRTRFSWSIRSNSWKHDTW